MSISKKVVLCQKWLVNRLNKWDFKNGVCLFPRSRRDLGNITDYLSTWLFLRQKLHLFRFIQDQMWFFLLVIMTHKSVTLKTEKICQTCVNNSTEYILSRFVVKNIDCYICWQHIFSDFKSLIHSKYGLNMRHSGPFLLPPFWKYSYTC
jgi:hypothetical protein